MNEALIELINGAVKKGLSPLKIQEPLTLSEWSDKFFYLSAESSSIEGKWETFPNQRGIMNAVGDDDIRVVTLFKSARLGYALSIDTQIPTTDGFKQMGDICVGDRVFDENGEICNVTLKSDVYCDHDCYEVVFDDGCKVVADGDHRWMVTSRTSLGRLYPDRFHYRESSGVLSTEEIFKNCRYNRNDEVSSRARFSVQNTKPVKTKNVDINIDLYWLGYWLGDGSRSSADITVSRFDIDNVVKLAIDDGYIDYVMHLDVHGNFRFNVDPSVNNAGFHTKLNKLGFIRNKHIPSSLLFSSVSQRVRLLQGLMDSDGTIGDDGRCEFYNTDKSLSDGVFNIVSSLGLKPYRRERENSGNLPNGKVAKSTKTVHCVGFSPGNDFDLFRLGRKRSRHIKSTNTIKRRIIKNVQKIDSVPVQCISVDSQSSLFLCTDRFIPTHNTKTITAAIGYFIEHKQRNLVVFQPTDTDSKDFSADEVGPMVRDVPVVRERMIGDPEKKGKHNTLHKKTFIGVTLDIKGGTSARNYRRMTKDTVFYDELDGFPMDVDGEGSPLSLGDMRVTTSSFPKSIRGSTPATEGESQIQASIEDADVVLRRFVPCKHCGTFSYFLWERFSWADGNPQTIMYGCPDCGGMHTYSDYPDMDANGYWASDDGITYVGDTHFTDASGQMMDAPYHVAFKIWAAYSYFTTWSELATEFINANRAKDRGDLSKLKSFVNTRLGELWSDAGESVTHAELMDRRETYGPEVPEGALFLTAGVDVQDDRVELEVVAWGIGFESWSMAYNIINGPTAVTPNNPGDKESVWYQLDEFLKTEFRHVNGMPMRITSCCIDSGGHSTQNVYRFCTARRGRRVFAIKGMAGEGRRLVSKFSRSKKYKADFLPLGVDNGKEMLYSNLRIVVPGVSYCHFPDFYLEDYFLQLTAEKCTVKYVNGRPVRQWMLKQAGMRNEALDCRVYARAAAEVININFAALQNQMASRSRAKIQIQKRTKERPNPEPKQLVRPTRPRKRRGTISKGVEL